MTTHEKQKKGAMYVYKLDTVGHPPTPPQTTSKKVVSRSWGLLKRSKTYREADLNHQHDYGKEEKKEMVQESARKSVSVMEGGRNSVSLMEFAGRRSVGNAAEMGIGKVEQVATVLQVRVLVTDMPPFMQIHAFRCARQTYDSLEKFSAKQIALNLKKEFDKVYGPAWHCIVGSNFGSFVTHATGCFLYFSMEKLYILVFKTKVKKSVK
ncbi:dynein light chain, type 1/2 [Artemisia annua]|uniref:Dynein light chain, type 1/2 n=1 Tax=Artemisia annua TaxID=35608 RepID=A0A2U1KAZ2_ARTAN|nr:dynein light chain, type 1/2 [Artemisia annua]